MMLLMQVIPIPAFSDNYLWLMVHGTHAAVVDPGDAAPVMAYLKQHQLTLSAILVTHHHSDHIGGINTLLKQFNCPVYAPHNPVFDFPYQAVAENDEITLLGTPFKVLNVPGHTAIHIAYYGGNSLFCGDTLFGCGCGFIFDGSAEQLHTSLQKIAQLPDDTLIYCAHEYTLNNIRFALSVDPDNRALQARQQADQTLRDRGLPTLPSTLQLEKATNPFLRCHTAALRKAANSRDELAVFRFIRELKNNF